jgi:hypothetical protein
LAGTSHITANSPCRGAGSTSYSSGRDIDGEPWSNPPSIGCDEYRPGALTGPLTVAIGASVAKVAVQFAMDLRAQISGPVTNSEWDFGDGTVLNNQPYVSHAWDQPGDYSVVLRAYNDTHPEGVSGAVTVHVLTQPVHYAWAASPSPAPPYSSWATAAPTIQEAVDAATLSGALVLVTNGVYASGGRSVFGTMTNRVAVDRPLIVRSVNGPAVTIIQGYSLPGSTNGDGAVRCAYLSKGAVLSGFTLTNGATRVSGEDFKERAGGAVWAETVDAVVTNCTLTRNAASEIGGAAYACTLYNCTLAGNTVGFYGGGAAYSTMNDCVLTGNSAYWYGGGAYASTLNYCTITNNSALGDSGSGGGTYSSTMNRCTLTHNQSYGEGGGAGFGTLNECLIIGNRAKSGGGARSSTLNNWVLPEFPGDFALDDLREKKKGPGSF